MKQPTLADIAARCQVSISTVSRALSDHPSISESRKREIRALAEQMGFQVRTSAKTVKGAPSKLLALVVSSLSHPFYSHLLERIEAQCSARDYQLLTANSWGSPSNEKAIVRGLLARQVDGVFFVPSSLESSALGLCAASLPTVVVSHCSNAWTSVGVSHEEGGRLVAEHLLELGRSSCLLIGSPSDPKLLGFQRYFASRNITGFKHQFLVVENFSEEITNQVRRMLLDRYDGSSIHQFDSVFAQSDLAAIGAMHALQKLSVDIPGEIAVCGFDDIPLAQECHPPLSTIAQPIGQMAQAAMDLLSHELEGERLPLSERAILLKPHLIIRGSTLASSTPEI
jgi:DNA-binding LacI/PurR family transcriptional regulator